MYKTIPKIGDYKYEKDIILPFDYIIVPGSEAIKTCMEIRKDTSRGVTPIILGDAAEIEYLEDSLEYNNHLTPNQLLNNRKMLILKIFLTTDMQSSLQMMNHWKNGRLKTLNHIMV